MKQMLKMKCPHCSKRAFDISFLPPGEVTVTLKCPHCRTIIAVLCDRANLLPDR